MAGGWRLRGKVLAGWWFGLGLVVDSDWPFAIQLVGWLSREACLGVRGLDQMMNGSLFRV